MSPSPTTCAAEVEEEALRLPRSRRDAAALRRSAATAPSRKSTLLFVALCLSGIAVSVELTRVHLFVHTDPSYHSLCAISEGFNCETVAVSPYSVFAGLPVSMWGIAGYLVMGALGLWASVEKRLHPAWPWGLLLLLATFSVAMSVVLAFLSAVSIDSLCLLCMGCYAINTALMAICIFVVRRSPVRALDLLVLDGEALRSRPLLAVLLALAGAAAVGLLQIGVPTYWKTPGWRDLPKLASGADLSGHHFIGARDPVLTIVEFSDYECPHCRAAHARVRALAARHPTRIRLVHRHLPLDIACHPGLRRPFHTRACFFAEAAECAGLQGRFWEMNDALFSVLQTVRTDHVDPVELAVRLGLSGPEFEHCLDSHASAQRVANDVREAMTRKLTGTPTFLVGGRTYSGGVPEAELERLLREAP